MAKTSNTTVKRKTPPDPRAGRVKALQRRIREWDVDALLIVNPNDIRYLTGFVGDDSWALVRARGRQVWIISDFRFDEQIQREAPHARSVMRKKGLAEATAELMRKFEVGTLALPGAHVTLDVRKKLVKELSASNLKTVDDGLIEQRAVKDPDEIKMIRKALRIQQEAFRELCSETAIGLREGQVVTERSMAAMLEYIMRKLGADGPSFPTIVAEGPNAALPHAIPSARKIRKGSAILIDWGARLEGYCSDLTRVIALGKMPARVREIYEIVLEAQQAGIEAIKPGAALKDVDAAARKIIEDAGYGEQFGHSLGHGIGLDIHEQPTLSQRSKGELKPGQVVTVEPGIYLPDVGGVRIEDDVLVTERGCKVLSDLPKDLESAII